MNALVEYLKQLEGTTFENEDGLRTEFHLLPPLSELELAELSSNLPCPISSDIRELLGYARGFSGTWLQEITFSKDPEYMGFGFDEIFPHAITLAHDGMGNYWFVDLTSHSSSWGPIFYGCHDAPVIVFQTNSLLHFVEQVVKEGNRLWKGEISDVCGRLSDRIWIDNPGVLSFEHCIRGADSELKAFAESLDESWLFVDLRNPVLGDGFSWGRYGPKTAVKRFGETRLFAYQKKTLRRRFLESFA